MLQFIPKTLAFISNLQALSENSDQLATNDILILREMFSLLGQPGQQGFRGETGPPGSKGRLYSMVLLHTVILILYTT